MTARPVEARLSGAQRFVVGMDGIRRAIPMPVAHEAAVTMASPAGDGSGVMSSWSLPSLHWPQVNFRRSAMAVSLVALALGSSVVMARALATPQASTARAANEHVASTPKPVVPAVVAATPTPQKPGLQHILDTFVAPYPNKFGIVVKDLTTGQTATINPAGQVESASLYKLFVAQRIFQRIDLGQLDYGTAAGGDTGRTVDGCLTIMINISDNDCGRALGSILGWGEQNQALGIEGYKETSLASPQQTSAEDVATLLSRLYNGTLISGNASAKFLALLKDQRVNNRLPQGLPAGTVIAHKTGDLDNMVHDAGIVYGPKTNYLVVVVSGPWSAPGNAPGLFANLSSQLWNYFEQ